MGFHNKIWCLHDHSLIIYVQFIKCRGHRGHDRMVVGFTTLYAISAYHHWCCEFESRSSGRGVQHYAIKFVTSRWFSPGPPVSSTNKTDRHDITEILLKVALNTIKLTNTHIKCHEKVAYLFTFHKWCRMHTYKIHL